MKKLIVPVDFSECAQNAATYALGLAQKLYAEVHLLHVLSVPVIDPHMPPDMAENMMVEGENIAKDKLEQLIQDLHKTYDVPIKTHLRQGFFLAELEAFVDQSNPNYVIMGTQGATGLKTLVGSNTSHAIERMRVPILAIPATAHFAPIKSIVYATDLVADDYQYLDQLLSLAQHFDATITCLHVCSKEHEIDEVQLEDLKTYYAVEMRNKSLQFATIEEDDVIEGLDNYLEKEQVDLLAMLTHRRNLLERIFHKSVTRKMAIHTHLPLLAFHK